jgi:DNA-binding NarL/FixJ family response regulator
MIADDHAMVRDGLRPFIASVADDVQVVEAASLDDVLAAAAGAEPDILLLDLNMPGMDGAASVAMLCERLARTRVVVLSGDTTSETVRGVLAAGACGFLPKTLHADTIVHALRLILSGGTYFPASALAERQEPTVRPAIGTGDLTAREREILAMIAVGATNKHIARVLNLTEITVKTHLRNIFRKIDVQNRTQAAAWALREGVES